MASLTADFELGTNGAAIAAADPGSANAWDSISVNGVGNSLKYDNTHAKGNLAAKCDTSGNVGGSTLLIWSTSLGTLTDWYGRVYLYATALPTGGSYRVVSDSNGNYPIFINASGTISMLDQGGFAITTAAAIALNQWVRIEFHWLNSTTVGQIELKLFNNADSTTPTETKTSAANRNTSASTTQLNIGLAGGGAVPGPIWLDNIVMGAPSYPGPAAAGSLAVVEGDNTPAVLAALGML